MTTYYTVTGWPSTASRGTSSLGRAELVLIQTGFATVNTEMLTKGAIAGQTWTGTHNFTAATTSFGSPTATTQAANDNSTKIATTAYADRKGAITGQTWTGAHDFTGATASFASPTATTQSVGDSSTKVATTAFVAANQVLSLITAAGAANTIANADYAQTWNWALTTAGKTAFKFGETSAATNGAGSQYLVNIATAAASTANPLNVATRGVDTLVVSRTGDVTITALNGTTGSGTTGSAVTITAGQGASTSAGGAVNITSGAGGSTSGAAGAISITAGSATSANGASVTITAGAGAGGTNAGGNINLVPGAAVSTGTPGEVQVNGSSDLMLVNWGTFVTGISYNVFVATRACRVKSVQMVWGTASTSYTYQINKCTSGTAIGSGTAILSAAINTSGTTNTPVSGSLVSTVATLTLAAGDRLAVTPAGGTFGSLAGALLTIGIAPA